MPPEHPEPQIAVDPRTGNTGSPVPPPPPPPPPVPRPDQWARDWRLSAPPSQGSSRSSFASRIRKVVRDPEAGWLRGLIATGLVTLVGVVWFSVAYEPHEADHSSERGSEEYLSWDEQAGIATLEHLAHGADHPESWDAVLAPYVEFVSQTRELSFQHPVRVEFVDVGGALEEASEGALEGFDETTIAYFEDVSTVNAMLGLADYGSNPWSEMAEARYETAVAYYSRDFEVIVLPLAGGADLELSIVHELTHALQHQNGLFDGPYYGEDAAAMQLTLTEGDATRVERLWYDQLSVDDQRALFADLISDSGDSEGAGIEDTDLAASADYQIPNSYFETTFAAPYFLGELAVERIVSVGGHALLDRAIHEGEMSTEILIDPTSQSTAPVSATERYAANTAPAKAKFGLYGALGPLTMYLSLAPEIGASNAIAALAGYDNDSYQLWNVGSRSCIDLRVWFDSESQADEFESLVAPAWGDLEHGRTGLPSASSVDVVICGDQPVGDPANQTMDLLAPLLALQLVAFDATMSGVDEQHAVCGLLILLQNDDLELAADFADLSIVDRAYRAGNSSLCSD